MTELERLRAARDAARDAYAARDAARLAEVAAYIKTRLSQTDPQLTGAAPGFLTETKTIMLSTIPAPPYAELAARLAIVEDERDVALARAEMEVAARNMLMAEGERRATAAIVAYLRKARGDPAFYRVCMEVDNLRNHIEAGHHLPRDAHRAAYHAYDATLAAQDKEDKNV